MLNRQEQYWLDCWRRSQTVDPTTLSRRQRRNCLGSITHGLYAARVLDVQERAMVAAWAPLAADLRAEFPGEEERVEMLMLYVLFFVRAARADHMAAMLRAGHRLRFHLRRLQHPRPAPPPDPLVAQREFLVALAEAARRHMRSAENVSGAETPHA
jgi:hypothetical protein